MKNNLTNFLDLKEWGSEHSSVWREILSRWGQADYDDETKRASHQETLKGEWEAYQYGRDRQYPELGEQLDMLFHDMTAGKGTKSGEWYKAVAKVKTVNPKPTE